MDKSQQPQRIKTECFKKVLGIGSSKPQEIIGIEKEIKHPELDIATSFITKR